MTRTELFKLAAAVVILGLAVVLGFRYFSRNAGVSEQAFFYDLSEKKLFTAPRNRVPPFKGPHSTGEDAVRAVVVSTNGNATDKRSWKIAYLEKYSPEAKRQLERAQAGGPAPELSRTEMLGHRFVKRLADIQWFPMATAEAELIVTDWAVPGPNGVTPVVCTP